MMDTRLFSAEIFDKALDFFKTIFSSLSSEVQMSFNEQRTAFLMLEPYHQDEKESSKKDTKGAKKALSFRQQRRERL